MHLREYQLKAGETDQSPAHDERGILIPLLGLAGEVGTLLSEYKKHLRDGSAHLLFKEQVAEELGDLMWYVADVATKFDLDLDKIAVENLEKTQARWPGGKAEVRKLFDETFPAHEQLPRHTEIQIREEIVNDQKQVRCYMGARLLGDTLTNNAWEDDGYRFHDVFHLAHLAVLGWSPIMRRLLGRKRKSDPQTDEVEDGARAGIIEEAVVAIVYDYARKHNYLEGVHTLDYQLLKTIMGLVSDREVRNCSLAEWQRAILTGYQVWRQVRDNRGGIVVVDLTKRKLEYRTTEPRTGDAIRGVAHVE